MKLKNYHSYHEVEDQYKWDLEDILGQKTYQEIEDEYFNLFEEAIKTKDSKYESIDAFIDSIKLSEKIALLGNKIENYIHNKLATNLVDFELNTLSTNFTIKNASYAKRLGSELNRVFTNQEKIQMWLDDDRLKDVKKDLQELLKDLKYKLNDNVESYLNDTAKGAPALDEIFSILTDSETQYGYATSKKGKKYLITEASRQALLKNTDEKVRKETYSNYLKAFLAKKQTLAKLLYQSLKELSVNSLYRSYPSTIDALISGDHITKDFLITLYDSVSKNSSLIRKFATAKAKFFKKKFNKKQQIWDTSVDLVKVKSTYSVEEAKQILLDITSVMPFEYPQIVKEALETKWVDYMNVPNKRSGAYSIGSSYGISKKYILMNFNGTIDSVNTLCHEMGHSLHSYYSDKTQPFARSQYPIFLAEIASIFNELLLNDYLITKTNNKKEKFMLLENSISDFLGTVVRQTQWSNYEYELYEALDKDEPVDSYEALEELYVKVAKQYAAFPKRIKKGLPANVYSVMVPHFYYNFYVYKYAIGYIVANVFFQKYKQEGKIALENYVTNFLSAGDSDWPAEILKKAGVDIYSKQIYDEAFALLESKINEYIALGNEIFKTK
ncbi:Oligoendopeptidase F, plasmid [Metamycoplasma arthritidis]|uniref:Oligopeptidase F n=1 Tax=Metamycoplasma arthritidis (strain 158L3-1) TaxID=243272 RepID=B3PMZ6_META1|nr:oligoendopeptidase F [Metamycoplasma arthritidis]ACF07398.1 oligoendopeptidase F [Metamycoplasma arthritidis 158L3-1]VEU78920.1 Oligoendopeptidase F, plasmid [Metamycoplasma arthritidis]